MTQHTAETQHTANSPAPARSAATSLESGLGFQIGRVHRMLRAAWEEQIADVGLSPPQAAMLRAVGEWPGSGLRALARRARTDVMNAKRLIGRLVSLGLVDSAADSSHRQRRVFALTPEGAALAAELGVRAASWNRHLAAQLGARDLGRLHTLLGRLEEALDQSPARRAATSGRRDDPGSRRDEPHR